MIEGEDREEEEPEGQGTWDSGTRKQIERERWMGTLDQGVRVIVPLLADPLAPLLASLFSEFPQHRLYYLLFRAIAAAIHVTLAGQHRSLFNLFFFK